MTHILAIDQGTTSSRAIIFDDAMNIVATAQEEFTQHFPQSGWVEHDPSDLWSTTAGTCRAALEKANLTADDIAGIGITNQRETTLVWDRHTGQPIHNAIVWQDRRTSDFCRELREQGHADVITEKTGLLADPYFSGTKLKWLLDNVEGARAKAEAGDLLFGTVDSFLIWKLTGGKAHLTDATNAARTMLYDIHKGRWSSTICDLFGVPMNMLPEVRDCASDFGMTRADLPALSHGMLKSTYGTGCFALLNTGDKPVTSQNRLLTTIAYQLDGKPTYALEGSIFIAGAVVQWLRDGLKIIREASETQPLAETADEGQNVVLVPAFTGLGAPYWNAECRGAIFGLTRGTGPAELARAALESVGYQTRDLLEAMQADMKSSGSDATLRVDGGMSASDWAMQFLADIIGADVDRPRVLETTALGACMAGRATRRRLSRSGRNARREIQRLETRSERHSGVLIVSSVKSFSFLTASDVRFGRGSALAAASTVAQYGKRALLVRGRSVAWVDTFASDLGECGCQIETLFCQAEPDLPALQSALSEARAFAPDVVVAIGGGAVLDMGKALAALIPAKHDPMEYLEVVGNGAPLDARPLAFIALPTTAGTGAEVTKNAVIGVPSHDNAPKSVTAASGLDAITQVIEPYISAKSNVLTDALCRDAIPRGLNALIRLMQSEDAEARDDLALTSLFGGMALANSGLGVVHGLAGVLGGATGAPHGLLCGRMLPSSLKVNRQALIDQNQSVERIDQVADWISSALGTSAETAFDDFERAFVDWNLPVLTDWIDPDADLETWATEAKQSSSMKGNPVALTTDQISRVLRGAVALGG
ncbi:Glycerol kinase [Nymphon striatum]|nr:Glycerol kinase [Nymphon striatum]